MGSAIWSTPCDEMLRFPAVSFLRFFDNHGLLSLQDHPQWKTVVGGSCTYIKKMREQWEQVEVRLNTKIAVIKRMENGITVKHKDSGPESFDHVVIATHADQALALLEDPDQEEEEALGAWKYASSRTLLHTDSSVLPPLQRVWSSWNFKRIKDLRTSLTYDMTRLQGLQTSKRMLVTLNPDNDPEGLISEYAYEHPMFTSEAVTQASSPEKPEWKTPDLVCRQLFRQWIP